MYGKKIISKRNERLWSWKMNLNHSRAFEFLHFGRQSKTDWPLSLASPSEGLTEWAKTFFLKITTAMVNYSHTYI